MGDGFRMVKIAAIVMGVLIVLGTTVLIVMVVKRGTSGTASIPDKVFSAVLDEAAGTSIASVTPVHDRLAVHLRGGGPDRILIVDPVTGLVTGRVLLAR